MKETIAFIDLGDNLTEFLDSDAYLNLLHYLEANEEELDKSELPNGMSLGYYIYFLIEANESDIDLEYIIDNIKEIPNELVNLINSYNEKLISLYNKTNGLNEAWFVNGKYNEKGETKDYINLNEYGFLSLKINENPFSLEYSGVYEDAYKINITCNALYSVPDDTGNVNIKLNIDIAYMDQKPYITREGSFDIETNENNDVSLDITKVDNEIIEQLPKLLGNLESYLNNNVLTESTTFVPESKGKFVIKVGSKYVRKSTGQYWLVDDIDYASKFSLNYANYFINEYEPKGVAIDYVGDAFNESLRDEIKDVEDMDLNKWEQFIVDEMGYSSITPKSLAQVSRLLKKYQKELLNDEYRILNKGNFEASYLQYDTNEYIDGVEIVEEFEEPEEIIVYKNFKR